MTSLFIIPTKQSHTMDGAPKLLEVMPVGKGEFFQNVTDLPRYASILILLGLYTHSQNHFKSSIACYALTCIQQDILKLLLHIV